MSYLNILNEITEGWTENNTGMLINKNTLDIIDVAPAINEWFFISEFGTINGYETRNDAIEGYIATIRKNV